MKKIIILLILLPAVVVPAQETLSISDVFTQNNSAVVYITQALFFEKSDILNPDLFERFEEKIGTHILESYFPLSSGTGFIITNDGYLITNQHVIDKKQIDELKESMIQGTTTWLTSSLPEMGFSKKEITSIIIDFKRLFSRSSFHYRVRFYNKEEYSAKVIAKDKEVDLALLKVKFPGQCNIVIFNDTGKVVVGDSVIAIGYPLQNSIETFLEDFQPTLSSGIISAIRTDIWGIQHTASINPGNSGGPLFNSQGKLIGVNVGGVENANDIYFSIPLKNLIAFLKDNKKSELVEKNNSGIRLTDSGEMIELGPLETGTSLLIKGEESNRVYLDDELKGNSPLLLENMAEGERILRVESENQYHQRTIVVKREITAIKEYNPVLQYYTGHLYVKAEPVKAKVFIDDTFYGESPCAISNLNEGAHKLLITHNGFADLVREVNVVRDETIHLSLSLEKLYRLTLSPEPVPDTRIILTQGTIQKDFTAGDSIELVPGEWIVSLKGNYYTTGQLMVTIQESSVELDIRPLFTSSEIHFTNLKAGSTIRIDGTDITSRVKQGKHLLTVGSYHVTVMLKNYLTYTTEILVEPKEVTKIHIDYQLLPGLVAAKNYKIGIPTVIGGLLTLSTGVFLANNQNAVRMTEDFESYQNMKMGGYALLAAGTAGTLVGGFFLTKAIIKSNSTTPVSPGTVTGENISLSLGWNNGISLVVSF